jgi:hemoglobin
MRAIENREDIMILVNTFYDKVQKNEELNYFFNDIAQLDWEAHLPKMYDFWETILFHKSGYKGNPMRKHVNLHKIAPLKSGNFDTWLHLFKETVDELFEGELAAKIKTRATSIATAIQLNTVYQK